MRNSVFFILGALASSILIGIHLHDVGEGIAVFATMCGSYLIGISHARS